MLAGTFEERQAKAHMLVDAALHLVTRRVESLVVAATEPPWRYAHALSDDPAVAQAAVTQMQQEWQSLQDLEHVMAAAPGSCQPLEAMHWRLRVATRAVFMAYEADQWAWASVGGQALLTACLLILPWQALRPGYCVPRPMAVALLDGIVMPH